MLIQTEFNYDVVNLDSQIDLGEGFTLVAKWILSLFKESDWRNGGFLFFFFKLNQVPGLNIAILIRIFYLVTQYSYSQIYIHER